MSSSPLRIAIIGLGRHAARMVSHFREVCDVAVVAVASREPSRARKFATDFNIPIVCDRYEDVLRREDIDAVYLALPNHLHAEYCIAAAEQRKHVLCEKPLCLTTEEIRQISSAARRYDVHVQEGFWYHYHPAVQEIVRVCQSGEIGELRHLAVQFTRERPDASDIRWRRAYGGGSLWDVGVYLVHFALLVAGALPDKVLAVARMEDGVDVAATGILQFPSGFVASLYCGMDGKSSADCVIQGKRATLRTPCPRPTKNDFPWFEVGGENGWERRDFSPANPFALMIQDFCETACSTKKSEGLAFSQQVLEATLRLQQSCSVAIY